MHLFSLRILLIIFFLSGANLVWADELPPKLTPTEKVVVKKAASAAIAKTVAMNPNTAADHPVTASDVPPPPLPPVHRDPLEGFNRAMFSFNDTIDRFFLKPVATFYNLIMPKPLNAGVHNFFNNLGQLPTVANDLLQLNFYQAMNDSWRFVINSTIGIGGLFDVASRIGLKYYANDFGLTLAIWGWRDSTYIVLPLIGPNTIRDVVEIPVDYYFSVYPYVRPPSRAWQLYGLGIIDRRAQLLQFQSVFEQAAIDKYIFTRNAYLQRRAYQIEENKRIGYRGQTSCQKQAPYGQ